MADRGRRSWLLARGGRAWFGRLRAEVAGTPPAAFRRYLLVLLVGAVITGLSTYLVVQAGAWAAPRGLQQWDAQLLRTLVAHGPVSFLDAISFESPGNLTYLFPLTTAVAVFAVWQRHLFVAISILAAYHLQRIFVFAGWSGWDRPRPTLVADGIAAPALHSYPSGHAALSFAVYGYLAWLWLRHSRSPSERVFVLLVTGAGLALIGLARIALGAHWPSDILAGWLIALVWVACVAAAQRAAERQL